MLVVLKPEMKGKVDEAALKSHMAAKAAHGKLPRYGVPDRYIIVDDLPETSVGKLDKKTIRQTYFRTRSSAGKRARGHPAAAFPVIIVWRPSTKANVCNT